LDKRFDIAKKKSWVKPVVDLDGKVEYFCPLLSFYFLFIYLFFVKIRF